MEPRPPSRSTRPPAAEPAPSYNQPGAADRAAWSQPGAPPAAAGGRPPTGGYAEPPPRAPYPPVGQYATVPPAPAPAYAPPADPNGATTWHEPAANAHGGSPGGPGYSPGPALRPIDGGGARWLGPLLALVILAAVAGTVIFVIVRVLGGDGPRDPVQATGPDATQIAAAATPTGEEAEARDGGEPATGGETPAVATDATEAAPRAPAGDDEAADANPRPTRTPAPETVRPTTARQMLPSSRDLPDGFTRTEDDKRSRDEVAASFADPAEALARLEDWDWRENAFRTFEITDPNADPTLTTYVNISVHRFDERTGTARATQYFADAVIAGQGLEEVEIEPIGDQTIVLRGAPDGVNLVVVYVREGNYLIRIGGSSPEGDPTELLVEIAKDMVR